MSNKWLYEHSRNALAQFLSHISADDMENVLDDLLTPQDIIELQERLSIFHGLIDGKPQRKIAQELWVSITTVNRWSRVLQFGTGVIKKYL